MERPGLTFVILILLFLAFSFFVRERRNNGKFKKEIKLLQALALDEKYNIEKEIEMGFSFINPEAVLFSLSQNKKVGKISELVVDKRVIIYKINDNSCNPCISELNEKILIILNCLKNDSFMIIGSRGNIVDQYNFLNLLGLELHENLFFSHDQFFITEVMDYPDLVLFTLDKNLKSENLIIPRNNNVYFLQFYLQNAIQANLDE
jgi:hypothetical protein